MKVNMLCKRVCLKLGAACLFIAALVIAVPVQATPVNNWEDSFLLQGSNEVNPLVRVNFYPPDEILPAPVLGLSDPTKPSITLETGTDPSFEITFAIAEPSLKELSILEPDAPPDNDSGVSLFGFSVLNAFGVSVFDVTFEMSTSSGGVVLPGTWVAFNPQPEPPALPAGFADIGFQFDFSSLSDATLSIQVLDSQGNAISFEPVPEPSTFLLMAVGLAGVAVWRKKSKARRKRLQN